jgi:hypothetical protein
MGAGASNITQNNYQETQNRIVQISEQNCINTVLNTSQIKVKVINSTLGGDLNIARVNLINGVSCTLRASLDNELINKQGNSQDGEISDVLNDDLAGFGSLLSNLTPWGAAVNFAEALRDQNLTQDNIQKVINEITQQINSSCQNRVSNENAPIDLEVIDSKVKGNTNISDEQKISNTSCVIENMTRNYVRNDQENTQEGVLKREKTFSLLSGLMMMIVIVVIVVIVGTLLSHGMKGKKGKK